MTQLTSNNWLNPLIDEIQATFTEHEFNARWSVIEGHHKVGEMLRTAEREHTSNITDIVRVCSEQGGMSERKLWYSVKFYDTFPQLDALPEGKDISFRKIRDKYLTESSSEETAQEDDRITCPNCGAKFRL